MATRAPVVSRSEPAIVESARHVMVWVKSPATDAVNVAGDRKCEMLPNESKVTVPTGTKRVNEHLQELLRHAYAEN